MSRCPAARVIVRDLPRALAPLALLGAAACGSSTTGPPSGDRDALTESVVTAEYVFRFAPGDGVDAAWQTAYHAWLHEAMALAPTPRVEYRKYRDLDHMRRSTGFAGNAWADPNDRILHTIWPRDDHEIVHVVVNHHWGRPPGLFSEGVAVAHQVDPSSGDRRPKWSGRPVHLVAREIDAAGGIPDLESVIETSGFAAIDPETRYPVAGSFVRHLLDEAGLAPFAALARTSGPDDPAAKIRADFRAAYGESLDAWWARWLASIRS